MATLNALYGPPDAALSDARVKPSLVFSGGGNEFDDDEPAPAYVFRSASPQYTVTRQESLYLLAPRDQLLRALRERHNQTITCQSGAYVITVAHGSSNMTRRARTVLRTLQDVAATAATPLAVTIADQQAGEGGIGGRLDSLGKSLKSVFTLKAFDVVPLLNADHSRRQNARLKDSVVQISAQAANAFAAAAAGGGQMQGTPFRLDQLADRLEREFGF